MPNYTGTSVEEAIQKGLTALKLTKDQATISVLDEGKKGFLGFGKKEAVVEITASSTENLAENQAEIDMPATLEDQPDKELPLEPVQVFSEPNQAGDEKVELKPKEAESTIHTGTEDHAEGLSKEAAIEQLADYLTKITKEMNAPAQVKIAYENQLIIFHLETERQGMLIGKHGKILNALQYLAQVFVHRVTNERMAVVVNVGNYREKRADVLKRLAERTADKVESTGSAVFLEPMPAFERKQIHSVLSENPYVKTHSEGDEPYRYLVIEPAKF